MLTHHRFMDNLVNDMGIDAASNIEVGYGTADGADSYQAGVEAARHAVSSIKQHNLSAILVFTSVNFDLDGLLKGVASVVGRTPILGTTTAGEICNAPLEKSVVVVALASPHLEVGVGLGTNVSKDWRKALTQAVSALDLMPFFSQQDQTIRPKFNREGKAAFCMLFSPGSTMSADSYSFDILEELKSLTGGQLPIFGGSSADDWNMENSYVLLNQKAYRDSVLVAVFETGLRFGMGMAHGFRPGKLQATVTRASENEVLELDGKPAADVYTMMLGGPSESLDGKHLTMTTGRPSGIAGAHGRYDINEATFFTQNRGVRFAQPVREGSNITIMDAEGADLAGAGQEALRKAFLNGGIREPALVLAFSSALRARAMGKQKIKEITALKKMASGAPVAGFYSFGEQSLADDGAFRHSNDVIAVFALGKELSLAAEVARENARLVEELEQKVADLNKAREELRIKEDNLRDLYQNAPNAYFSINASNGNIVTCNDTAASMLGYDKEDLLKMRVMDLYADTPDGRIKAIRVFERFKSGKPLKDEELQMKRKNGEVIWVSLSVDPVKDVKGTVKQSRSVVIDITDRKRGEQALRDERKRLYSLLNRLPGWVSLQAPDYFIKFANRYFFERFGDAKGRRCHEIFHGSNKPCKKCRTFRVFDTGIPEEREWKQESTGLIYQIYNYPFTDVDGSPLVLELGLDITERKKAEEALQRERNLVARINETNPAGIAVVGSDGQITFANPMAEKVLGLSKEKITQRSYNAPEWRITDYDGGVFPDDQLPFSRVVATGKPVFGVRHAIEWPDGRRVLLSVNAAPLFDDAGELDGIVATVEDVTEKVHAETALREEYAFRDAIIASAAEGLCVCHNIKEFPYVHFTVWNDRMTEITGYTMDEINQKGWYQSVYPDPEYQKKARERMEAMRVGDDLAAEEWEITRADGVKRWLRISTSVFKMSEGVTHVLALMSDETERRKLEVEMQRSQRLESVGTLAGGIAHDFNNLLMAIWGNIDLAKKNTGSADLVYKSLEQADKACRRAKDLTQQLITFSKGGAPVKKMCLLPDLVQDSAKLSLSGANVKCEMDLPDGLWASEVDAGQIIQVFNNIFMNAAQAQPDGGTINVSGENITLSASEDPPLAPGKYVKLDFRDHGKGIEKDTLPRIFDPYFTTSSHRSGLGLAVVHSIIQKHDGYIGVESEPGKGSTFTVYLPVSDITGVETEYSQADFSGGDGRILVMDDEDMVRTLVKRFLTHLGYRAEFARDGAEAVDLYKRAMEKGRSFDAVILDLTVPGGMGGEEAVKWLLQIDPRAKVIVSSGYSNAPLMSRYKEHGFCSVISKPYKIETLGKVLKDVIKQGH